jgi:hypothetical protein
MVPKTGITTKFTKEAKKSCVVSTNARRDAGTQGRTTEVGGLKKSCVVPSVSTITRMDAGTHYRGWRFEEKLCSS